MLLLAILTFIVRLCVHFRYLLDFTLTLETERVSPVQHTFPECSNVATVSREFSHLPPVYIYIRRWGNGIDWTM